MMNPCGEIRLGKPEPVSPEWQVPLMIWVRDQIGKPYTQDEINELVRQHSESLENCRDAR